MITQEEIKRLARQNNVRFWPTRLYVIELLLVIIFLACAMVIGFSMNKVTMTIKVLDFMGLVNALFLTAATYRPSIMPNFFKPRHRTITGSGFTVMGFIPQISTQNGNLSLVFRPVPIALLGAFTYGALVVISFCTHPYLCILGIGIAMFGVAFSARMMYLMFRVIRVPCVFCLFSAGTMVSVATLMVINFISLGNLAIIS